MFGQCPKFGSFFFDGSPEIVEKVDKSKKFEIIDISGRVEVSEVVQIFEMVKISEILKTSEMVGIS